MTKLFKKLFNHKKMSESGFSLIEVLLAVVLLAILISPIIQVLYTSLSLNQKSRILMGATDCGQSILEYFESMTSEEITTLLEKDSGTLINMSCVGYNGYINKIAEASYLAGVSGNSFSSPYNGISDEHFEFARWEGLNYYAKLNSGATKAYITYVDDAKKYYAFNDVEVNGYYYTVVVYIETDPTFSSETYTVDNIRIDVYYNDKKKDLYFRYAMEDYMVSLNGSVFNKTVD